MTHKLPIAVIIPHAGLTIPPELTGCVALTENQIFNEADAYTDQIYDYRDRVLYWLEFPYARAVLDVNRPLDVALNRLGDGVVKQRTSYGDGVYYAGQEPDTELEQLLINRYWRAWHDQLAAIAADQRVKLVIDGHSMAAVGPNLYDDPGQARPRVSVSNLGDLNGRSRSDLDPLSAPPELAQALARRLGDLLADLPALAATGAAAAVNVPFFGGWDLAAHGGKHQPWLMLEINRALYVGAQDNNSPIVAPDPALITPIRQRIWQALEEITLR